MGSVSGPGGVGALSSWLLAAGGGGGASAIPISLWNSFLRGHRGGVVVVGINGRQWGVL